MMDRATAFRKQMKEQDPERYREYLNKQKIRAKERRYQLKKELQKKNPNSVAKQKKEHELQMQRERQRRYLEKKRTENNGCISSAPKATKKPIIETRNSIQSKREYNREKKREERSRMSYQKKMWVRKKDRERKAKLRTSKKLSTCPPSQSTSHFGSKKTEWNITSKVRAAMPRTPTKFAKVLDNIEKRATPRKRQAIDELKNVESAKRKKVVKKDVEKNTNIPYSAVKPSARLYLAKRRILKRKSRVDVKGIQMFYLRDDISRVLPQKRFATKDGPGYAMQVSIKAAHAKYNFENNSKVSLGKFASLRKRNVRLLSNSHRDFCCCPYCTNIRFKLLTLSRASSDQQCKKTHENDVVDILLCPKTDNEQFHDPKCINGGCNQCSNYEKTLKEFYKDIPEDRILTWNRWINETNTQTGMVKKVVTTEKGSINKLIHEMVEKDIKKPAQGYTFFQHMFTAQWQSKQFHKIKSNLPTGSVVQVMDFAKNREINYQSEIKGAFFTTRQVTMHPVVTYFKSGEGVTVRNTSIIISEDNNHDYHAVNHFEGIVNSHLENFVKIERRIIFSDGCASQYKSKGPFADIANNSTVKINRNFFGSEHGKNECDGQIGILNRALDRAIIGNQVVVNNAEDVFNYCHSHLEEDDPLSTRDFFLVKNGQINRNRPDTNVKTVASTRKFHQILNTTKLGLLRVRNLSCFCKQCESGDFANCLNQKYVGKYAEKQLQRNVPAVHTEENIANPAVSEHNSEKACAIESLEKVESQVNDPPAYSRQDFFQQTLNKMCQCESFEDLQILVPTIEEEVRELYGSINLNPDINIVSHRLTVDRLANEQPFDKSTAEATMSKLPVCVQGDGNCLPRSGSILAFGDEDHHYEIRCRIILEMARNLDLYLSVEHLKKGIVHHGKEAQQLVQTYAMFSEHYIPGKRLVPSAIYKKEVVQACKDKTYMGIFHIFALSSVLHCQLFSLYPQLGSELYSTTLNRLINPRQDDGSGTGYIMWSSTRQDMTASNWIPNHFVPVVNITVPSSETLVDELFEDDKELFELDSSVIAEICTDLEYDELLDSEAATPVVDMQEDVEADARSQEHSDEEKSPAAEPDLEHVYPKTSDLEQTIFEQSDLEQSISKQSNLKQPIHKQSHFEKHVESPAAEPDLEHVYPKTSDLEQTIFEQSIPKQSGLKQPIHKQSHFEKHVESPAAEPDLEHVYPKTSDLEQTIFEQSDLEQSIPKQSGLKQPIHKQSHFEKHVESPAAEPDLEHVYPKTSDLEQTFFEQSDLEQSIPKQSDLKQPIHKQSHFEKHVESPAAEPDLEHVYPKTSDLEQTFFEQSDLEQSIPKQSDLKQPIHKQSHFEKHVESPAAEPDLEQVYPKTSDLEQPILEQSDLEQSIPKQSDLKQPIHKQSHFEKHIESPAAEPDLEQVCPKTSDLEQTIFEQSDLEQPIPKQSDLKQPIHKLSHFEKHVESPAAEPDLEQVYPKTSDLEQTLFEQSDLEQPIPKQSDLKQPIHKQSHFEKHIENTEDKRQTDLETVVGRVLSTNDTNKLYRLLTTWKRFQELVSGYSASKELELAVGLWKRSLSL